MMILARVSKWHLKVRKTHVGIFTHVYALHHSSHPTGSMSILTHYSRIQMIRIPVYTSKSGSVWPYAKSTGQVANSGPDLFPG